MNRNLIIGILIGAALGFAGGFVFTNQVNRRETDQLRAELNDAKKNATAQTAAAATPAEPSPLTIEQVRAAVARADQNPRDIYLQRNLGQMLYLYSGQTKDATLLPDAIRLLERAYRDDPENFDTLVLLGNAHFDAAQAGDPRRFADARGFYEKALRLNPRDVRVRTDLGLTYFFGQPSDPKRAIEEYEKAIAVDPGHEATLQNLAAALIASGDAARARETLDRLERISPNNAAVSDLRAQLAVRNNETLNNETK